MCQQGKIDVHLVRGYPGAPGGRCYPDHLPVPGAQEPVNFSPKHSREFTLRKFDLGDRVRICVGPEVLRQLQEGHGGFHARMAGLVGATGRVHRVTAAGDIRVQYPGKPELEHRWTVHPAALAKVGKLSNVVWYCLFLVGLLNGGAVFFTGFSSYYLTMYYVQENCSSIFPKVVAYTYSCIFVLSRK